MKKEKNTQKQTIYKISRSDITRSGRRRRRKTPRW